MSQISTYLKSGNSKENYHSVVFLRNFGNLSSGAITRKIITPSRSVRSVAGVVGLVKSIKGTVWSVGSFLRGIPPNGENFFKNFKNDEVSFHVEDKNNQSICFSNNQYNLNNNSFFLSNNTPAISKNKNDKSVNNINSNNLIQNNTLNNTNYTSSNNTLNNIKSNHREVSNFNDILKKIIL